MSEELGPCELWKADADPARYGRVWRDGRAQDAHRWTWIEAHGEPPPGWHVHHRCETPACIRLDHLVALPVSQHHREHGRVPPDWQSEKTHCPQGHAYDEANTYVHRGRRYCRACHRESQARRAAR